MSMLQCPLRALAVASVAFVLSGQQAAASDGAYSIPDSGVELMVPAGGSGQLSFTHPAYEGAQAIVRIEDGRVIAGTEDDALTLGTFDPSAQWNDEMGVLLMDVDYDGYLDVGILEGVGYGGVNFFWSFYRSDAEQLFVPVGTLSNPERDDIMGTVLSTSRSGPFWTRDVYRPEGDSLNLQFSRTFWSEYDVVVFPGGGKGNDTRAIIPQIAPDPWDEDSLEEPMFHLTAMAGEGRSYFYDTTEDSAQRGAYLVEGDIGRILDADANGDWFYIIFTHSQTRITTEGWMRAQDLAVVQG